MVKKSSPSKLLTIIPLTFMLIALFINVQVWGDEATEGPNQLALMLAAILTGIIGIVFHGISYKSLEENTLKVVASSLQPIFILLSVGALIGIWILSGIVPAMIYWGLQFMSMTYFLPLTCILCALVSLATGSSWSTGGTLGIALIGTGVALGIPAEIIAGAVISGAYFGDKLSPMSDTTNLASSMAHADLFEHIQYMLYTTIPSFITTVLIFTIIGFNYTPIASNTENIDMMLTTLSQHFSVSPWLCLIPVIVILAITRKLPALPAIWLGIFAAALASIVTTTDQHTYKTILEALCFGHTSETGLQTIDDLLSRGGMQQMLGTIWLILSATLLGGMLEATGMLKNISAFFQSFVHGTKSLVLSTLNCGILLNLATSDQYISIILSAKLFKKAYKDAKQEYRLLSRSVEDSTTATSVLIPWNTCGAYFSSVLGVSTMSYLPYAIFNLLSPVSSIVAVFFLDWRQKSRAST